MTRTLIITAGALIDRELQAEFGPLPPSFLPIGNRRLYHHQAEAVRHLADELILTLPEGFELAARDQLALDDIGLRVLRVPDGVQLGESVVYAINMLGLGDCSVSILHGDTLIYGLDASETDAISVHDMWDAYTWAGLYPDTQGGWALRTVREHQERCGTDGEIPTEAASGYFTFSNAALLVKSITRARHKFVEGINLYHQQERPLTTLTAGEWLDFGHLQTFFRSRRKMTTQRAFNDLKITRHAVEKSSVDTDKMAAEASWFETISPELRVFAPTYLGRTKSKGRDGYRLAHLQFSTLSDLFVFGRLDPSTWSQIFDACDEFLKACATTTPQVLPAGVDDLYLPKTLARLESYGSFGIDPEAEITLEGRTLPSPLRMAEHTATLIKPISHSTFGVMHGDFCLSNIFYDFRSASIRVIDPRGQITNGAPTIYGDRRYDVAKLFHSIIGLYDLIVGGFFAVQAEGNRFSLEIFAEDHVRRVQRLFSNRGFAGISAAQDEIRAIAVHLFLSMVPLHSDRRERQSAFVANAARLYADLDPGRRT